MAAIFREGPAALEAGTAVVTVSGDISRQTTLRVPLGTTVASALEQAEGVGRRALRIKAVQFGGPAGRFLAGEALDTPIDSEALEQMGTT